MWKLYVLSSALWGLNRPHRIRESKVAKTFYAGCFALTFPLFGFADKPANVLVIMVDDIGYADMSFLPQAPDDVHTPHLDRLADAVTTPKPRSLPQGPCERNPEQRRDRHPAGHVPQ